MRLTALVSGTVQGVGYRLYVQRYARDLNLVGFAENVGDGRVEVVAEGHEEDLHQLAHQLRRGPKHARVSSVDTQWSESTGLTGFHIY
ncbi:acylphosphatase [Deinococcus rubellus]|uniref:acylphosphatase n=1 Tax=Deinococcus rubellus TaxID=1889240 RepID=A0ABY5YDT9_9DEIO|nr:acylphosphatase [Deinococcus rubellus]UWX63101.1 acylphosphatase [Deinococcus rubellus]